MVRFPDKYGKCARCGRKVRIFPEVNILDGLWEHEGKLYGYKCYQIVTGNVPTTEKKVTYYNPDWDNQPLPY